MYECVNVWVFERRKSIFLDGEARLISKIKSLAEVFESHVLYVHAYECGMDPMVALSIKHITPSSHPVIIC